MATQFSRMISAFLVFMSMGERNNFIPKEVDGRILNHKNYQIIHLVVIIKCRISVLTTYFTGEVIQIGIFTSLYLFMFNP